MAEAYKKARADEAAEEEEEEEEDEVDETVCLTLLIFPGDIY